MAATKLTTVQGFITPVQSGTRIRVTASTYGTIVTSVAAGSKVVIDQTTLYLETDTANPATQKNDLWGRVMSVNGVPIAQPAFMAVDYHGGVICTKSYAEVGVPVPPDPGIPPVVHKYPQRFQISPEIDGTLLAPAWYTLDPNQGL